MTYCFKGKAWVNVYFFTVEEERREEYLLLDFDGIVASVGGALGLFLGFSFYDFAVITADYARRKLLEIMHD